MKQIPAAVAFLVQLVAWAASAGSVLLLMDGWAGRLAATAIFAVIVALWAAAMGKHAPWPISRRLHYLCKLLLFTFAALVLCSVNQWAALSFAVLAVLAEHLSHYQQFHPATQGSPRLVSRAVGLDA